MIRSNRAFTTVELVVAVAIIILLISILVPILGKVRWNAKLTAGRAQKQGIAAACEMYKVQFNDSYPGYFTDAELEGNDFSATEGLVISLMGGMTRNPQGTEDVNYVAIDSNVFIQIDLPPNPTSTYQIGAGPILDGTTGLLSGRQYGPFYIPKEGELYAIDTSFDPSAPDDKDYMPELIDTATGLPILYFRARRNQNNPVAYDVGQTGTFVLSTNDEYLVTAAMKSTSDDVVSQIPGSIYSLGDEYYSLINSVPSVGNDNAANNLAWLVVNQTLSSVVTTDPLDPASANNNDDVVAGGVVLISPGIDGIYINQLDMETGSPTNTLDSFDDANKFEKTIVISGSAD